ASMPSIVDPARDAGEDAAAQRRRPRGPRQHAILALPIKPGEVDDLGGAARLRHQVAEEIGRLARGGDGDGAGAVAAAHAVDAVQPDGRRIGQGGKLGLHLVEEAAAVGYFHAGLRAGPAAARADMQEMGRPAPRAVSHDDNILWRAWVW